MRALLCCLFVSLLATAAVAATPKVSAGSVERLEAFPSKFVPPHNIDIWLPEGYPKAAPYAVLYMHDGQMLFDPSETWNRHEWRADEVATELMRTGKTRPFIIVGVWNVEPARHSEYFPQRPFASLKAEKQAELLATKRGDGMLFNRGVDSDNYLKFLVGEVKPYVDQHFAVDSSRDATVIMGSSMGGLVSMYALAEYPEVFGAAACLSTHWPGTLAPDDVVLQTAFFDYVDAHFPPPGPHRIYFDHGTETLDAMYPALQAEVDRRMRAKGYGPDRMLSLAFPGTDHSEVAWAARLHIPMQFLLPPSRRP